ncbi:MAG: phosphoribosylformylglycinamidine synthase, purS [Symbiobacteriaceae bacterium]|jgi:phosphoribosylformylglycinamidine synthase PurS subunit|nr:phosphoribosylformylglycinamidine synthase, purS [Symbiobacteriaceae bacterium]
MLYKAEVKVTLKKGVLDPQGSAVEGAVKSLGYTGVPQVRIGKYIELWVEAENAEQAADLVNELGRKILSNPITETFTVTVTESADRLVQTGVK